MYKAATNDRKNGTQFCTSRWSFITEVMKPNSPTTYLVTQKHKGFRNSSIRLCLKPLNRQLKINARRPPSDMSTLR